MFGFNKKKPSGDSITLKIDGMHCTSCSLNIDGELEDMDGVFSAKTSYAKSMTKVEFDQTKLNKQDIRQVIEKLGYKVIDKSSD